MRWLVKVKVITLDMRLWTGKRRRKAGLRPDGFLRERLQIPRLRPHSVYGHSSCEAWPRDRQGLEEHRNDHGYPERKMYVKIVLMR